jgi:hypothetical protein
MAKVLVLVETDHSDTSDAIRSVMDAMKRAGYNQKDYDMRNHLIGVEMGMHVSLHMMSADCLLQVEEPEVTDSGN